MRCNKVLNEDLQIDCSRVPVVGIENKVVLIPFDAIDRSRIRIERNRLLDFSLKNGARGYVVEGYSRHFTGIQKYQGEDSYTQELSLRIYDSKYIEEIEALTNSLYVAIILTKEGRYEVLGYDAGLEVRSLERDYDKNAIRFTLGTGSIRERSLLYFLDGDPQEMRKRFDRGFVSVWGRRIFDSSFDSSFE